MFWNKKYGDHTKEEIDTVIKIEEQMFKKDIYHDLSTEEIRSILKANFDNDELDLSTRTRVLKRELRKKMLCLQPTKKAIETVENFFGEEKKTFLPSAFVVAVLNAEKHRKCQSMNEIETIRNTKYYKKCFDKRLEKHTETCVEAFKQIMKEIAHDHVRAGGRLGPLHEGYVMK
jgi:hypothetical protein